MNSKEERKGRKKRQERLGPSRGFYLLYFNSILLTCPFLQDLCPFYTSKPKTDNNNPTTVTEMKCLKTERRLIVMFEKNREEQTEENRHDLLATSALAHLPTQH